MSHKRFRRPITTAALVVAATVVFGESAIARADTSFGFQTPSGNIACLLGPAESGGRNGFVGCEIGEHTYPRPPRPPSCPLAWGDRFTLAQGGRPELACHGDTIRDPNFKTLDYGETAFSGAIRCAIEPAGITCTDTSTGHFFRLSRESYELG